MREKPTIAVVEDDDAVRRGVVDALRFSGYEVMAAKDGEEGLSLALQARFDLLLLDLVMPKRSGFEILQALQEERPGQAVIILSAKGEEDDRVRGLGLGADDYVVKPFSVRELLARVNAVLRRSTERTSIAGRWEYEQGEVDFARREVRYHGGDREEFSEKEAAILRYLVSNGGRVVAREELLRQVWGLRPSGVVTRTIDMHVVSLRKKLRAPEVVTTVRGKGYMLARG
ncbi:MAG: response regulator transcription factor [Verrucomicrobiota bacterium JB023]|nr:response regulator transcription factor [Verrucomicrobiota bacterium JB023]